MTLSELSIGSHNITLFASGIFGNRGISNTTNFTISEQAVPNSGFQPILLALPIFIFILVLVVGVILYKRRKKV